MKHDVVILQHQPDAPAGLLLDALGERELSWQLVRMDLGEPLPDPASVAFAVSLGASASADDTSVPWLETELGWLRAMDRAGGAILGLCFGAQALALALGGGVVPSAQAEHGWIEVDSEEPELLARGPWQGWHRDRIEPLPPGARVIASNENAVQAFRYGAHLGLQFHPEVTPAIIADWARADPQHAHLAVEDPASFVRAAQNARTLFLGYLDNR